MSFKQIIYKISTKPSNFNRIHPLVYNRFYSSLIFPNVISNSESFTWAAPLPGDEIQNDVEKVFVAGLTHHHIANTAFPINHKTTVKPYKVQRVRDQKQMDEVLVGSYGDLKEMMLYAHVPFCQTRCQFCEYTVVDPVVGTNESIHKTYFDYLLKELKMYRELLGTRNKIMTGLDVGGGTPSIVDASLIGKFMDEVYNSFIIPENIELSIETTPKIAAQEADKIKAYKKMGFDRISMGLQTTDFNLAKRLGRDDENYVHKAVENIRTAGFNSFNIDLMYGFPIRPNSIDKWSDTVAETIALNPEHITLYRMRYKGTKMAHLQNRVLIAQVVRQQEEALQLLQHAGYTAWVGKNTFTRVKGGTGCSSYLDGRVIHGTPYIGIGVGAQSFSLHSLAYNLGAVTKKLGQYSKSLLLDRIPIQDLYHLPKRAAIGKFIAVSFYYGGIDLGKFEKNFGSRLEEIFPREVNFLLEKKLMHYMDNRFQMTPNGKKMFGGVVSLFYSPSVQTHLINLPGGEDHLHTIQSWKEMLHIDT